MNVHFICRGNAHRSVMAEAYLKSLNLPGVTVFSSGVVADKDREPNRVHLQDTRTMLAEHGIGDYAKSESEQLTQDRLSEDDVTICVNQIAYDEGAKFLTFPSNTIIWDINDTGEGNRQLKTGDPETYFDEQIFSQIKANIDLFVAATPARSMLSLAFE